MCNVVFEPWIWNAMRGEHDHYYNQMQHELQYEIPLHNPPYWREQLPPVPPVPEVIRVTAAGGSAHKPWRKKGTGKGDDTGAGRKSVGGKDAAGKGASGREWQQQQSGSDEAPPYANLTNDGNSCYVSSILQCIFHLPGLRQLLSATTTFSMMRINGDGVAVYADPNDTHLENYRQVFDALRDLEKKTTATEPEIDREALHDFRKSVEKVEPDFVIGQEHDAAFLFDTLCKVLNCATDTSYLDAEKRHFEITTPSHLSAQEIEQVRRGFEIQALRDDRGRQLNAHRSIGNASALQSLIGIQVALERECARADECLSPYSRSWFHMETIIVQFPTQGEIGYDENASWKIEDLITRSWIGTHGQVDLSQADSIASERPRCESDRNHGPTHASKKKITITPKLLVVRVNRLSVTAAASGMTLDEAERHGHFAKNPLILQDTLDLRPWIEPLLPTEQSDPAGKIPTDVMQSEYKLSAIVQYRNRHYVAYIQVPEPEQGNKLRWALFNDLEESVTWEEPLPRKVSQITLDRHAPLTT